MKFQNNSVELIGTYGGDKTHALSAWTSTSRDLTEEKEQRIDKLLKFLAEAGHHSPFEKSYLHFLVTCDTASHIHLIKHRIGVSVNAESARYKELEEDKCYLPQDWPKEYQADFIEWAKDCYHRYHISLPDIEAVISRKRAKETSRYYLPYANQLTLDIGFNFRSFMHFQGLRNKPEAQDEICFIAEAMLILIKDTGDFEASLDGFGY
jgi:flavin-dependent thymidylate synthase